MGSIYCDTMTKKGCATVWLYADHSSTIYSSSLSIEEIDDRWMQFFEYLAPVGKICVALGQCATDYMEWFYRISHPFMSLEWLGEPSRQPLVVHDDTFIVPDPHQ